MSVDLTRRLLALGLVHRDDVQRALFAHVSRHEPLVKLLAEMPSVREQAIDDELARHEAPTVRSVQPLARLVETLPPGMCRALLAIPVRQDVFTRTVDLAVVDPNDTHVEREFAHHLRSPIRLLRAPLAAMEDALRRIENDRLPPPEPPRPTFDRAERRTPPYMLRSEIDALAAASASSVPQLKKPSERPIPLVRRSDGSVSVSPEAMASLRQGFGTDRPGQQTGGPFSNGAPRGPFPNPGPLLEAVRQAGSRDEIIDLLLNGLAMLAGRVGTFVARKDHFQGWRCNEALADPESFHEVRIPADVPSILATAAATGFYLGPLPHTGVHAELLGVMGGIASEVAVTPVRVEGRLALLLFLDDIGDSMLATRRADEMGRVAGEALGRLVKR